MCWFNTAWFLVGVGEKLLETSTSSTEPITVGSDNGQVTSPIRQVHNTSDDIFKKGKTTGSSLFSFPRDGEAAALTYPSGGRQGPSQQGLPGAIQGPS